MKTNKYLMLTLIIILSLVLAKYNYDLSNGKIVEEDTKTKEIITTIPTTTTKATTTSTTTTTTTTKTSSSTTTTTKKKVVSTKKETKVLNDYSNYGTIIQELKVTTYNVYSDGTNKEKNSKTTYKFDASKYSATTTDLLKEATSNNKTNASIIKELLEIVNGYRKEVSASPLTLDNNLNIAASVRALELGYSNKFSHTRPNGSLCFTILKDLKISYVTAGENILAGYQTASSAAEGWKSSKDHYENMIDKGFKKTGIGLAIVPGSAYEYYWVEIFTA